MNGSSGSESSRLNVKTLRHDIERLLNDPTRNLRILGEFVLTEREKNYLRQAAPTLIEEANWNRIMPELDGAPYRAGAVSATDMRLHESRVEQLTTEMTDQTFAQLSVSNSFVAELTVTPRGQTKTIPCPTLELIFSIYDPQNIGVIDYHGANRDYRREQVGGINLNIDTSEKQRQHALYNSANKYGNIKSEMAAAHIGTLLAKEAGISGGDDAH